jgi:hypothetical protein
MIDFFSNPASVVFRAPWRREDPNDAPVATRERTKQLSPNVGSRTSFAQTPTYFQGVIDCFPDVFVWTFGHLLTATL